MELENYGSEQIRPNYEFHLKMAETLSKHVHKLPVEPFDIYGWMLCTLESVYGALDPKRRISLGNKIQELKTVIDDISPTRF